MSGWGGTILSNGSSCEPLSPETAWLAASAATWAIDRGVFTARAGQARRVFADCEVTTLDVFNVVKDVCLREFSRRPPTLSGAIRFLQTVLSSDRLALKAAAFAGRGSRDAWALVAIKLHDTVTKMPLSRSTRSEIVSESFLILRERAMETYDVTRPFGAFLHGIAKNVVRRIRSGPRHTPLPARLASRSAEPFEEAWSRERAELLSTALLRLEESEQRLLNKRILEGKRLRVIASEEGMKNPQEAHRRYHSALQALRRSFWELVGTPGNGTRPVPEPRN